MPIESNCQGCGRLLRVGDEHAGKLARCPHCQTIYTVPGSPQGTRTPSPFAETAPYPSAASASFPSASGKPGDRWTMKTPDGLTFGPVPRTELDRWLAEGRITPQSQLQQEGTNHWVWSGQIYPQLQAQPALGNNPFGERPVAGPEVNPYTPPAGGGAYNWPTTSYRFREQHRGGTILAMGLVSIPCCEIIAIATIVMAVIDLQKMSSGTMDPAGRGLTIAGLVCAIIKLVLVAGYIVVMIANQ
jgi:hypothetical protein